MRLNTYELINKMADEAGAVVIRPIDRAVVIIGYWHGTTMKQTEITDVDLFVSKCPADLIANAIQEVKDED